MMNDTDMLESLVDVAGEYARACLLDFKQRELVPSWLIVTGQGQIELIGTPWEDDRQKREQAVRIKKRLTETRAKAYSLVCEAWVAEYSPETLEMLQSSGFVWPVDRPDRQEFVVVTAASRTSSAFGRWRIVRAPTTEQITGLVRDDPNPPWTQPEGWMAHMLD
jgi:hypothetical protein